MIFWATINIATGLMVSAIVVYMLSAYHERFRMVERLIMVGVASGMILRIGPIVGTNILHEGSPYDGWSVAMLHLSLAGAAIAILNRMERQYKEGWFL